MHRKPRRPDEPLFERSMLVRAVLLGLAALAFSTAVYAIALAQLAEDNARALGFISLIVSNLALIFVSRYGRAGFAARGTKPNALFWGISATALAALTAVICIPAIAEVFRFAPPPLSGVVLVVVAAVVLILLVGSLSLATILQRYPFVHPG